MHDHILIGSGERIIEVSDTEWRQHLAHARVRGQERLRFMTPDHHRVRNEVVRSLPGNRGRPLTPAAIARTTDLPLERTETILGDLERHLFFLVRNAAGEVNWAFPVTVDTTPHRVTFSTGEQLFAAWAEDAIATPFVQGRLRQEALSVDIATHCAYCHRSLHLTVDSDLRWHVSEPDAQPLLFEPTIDWPQFTAPTIVHDYWHHSVFFCTEEHARAFRRDQSQVDGTYLSIEQSTYGCRFVQSALFAFDDTQS